MVSTCISWFGSWISIPRFKPYYIVDGDKKRTVSELKSALKNADELYLATDVAF